MRTQFGKATRFGFPAALRILTSILILACPAFTGSAFGGAEIPADSLGSALPDSLGSLPPDSLLGMPPGLPGDAPADSAGAAADSAAAGDGVPAIPLESLGIHPVFKSGGATHDTKIDVSSEMSLSVAYPNAWILSGRINYKRQLPRQIKQDKINTGFALSTSKKIMGKVPLRLSMDRSILLQEQNKGEANYRRDETERATVNMGASAAKPVLSWLGANMSCNVGVTQSETRNNQGLNRETNDGTRQLGAHLDFTPLEGLKVVTGYAGSILSGKQQLIDTHGDVETTSDSLQLRVDFKWNRKVSMSLVGGQLETNSERLDFLRDQYNLIVSIGGEDSIVVKEMTSARNWGGQVSLDLTPWERVNLKATVVSYQDERRVSNSQGKLSNKDKDGESLRLNLALNLSPWSGQHVDLSYKETNSNNLDFAADLKQIRRELLFQTRQTFQDNFSFSGEAFFLLNQDFYADVIKNPQDRDQAQTRLSMSVDGNVTGWLKAGNTLQWYENRDIVINTSRSIASKDKHTLSWRTSLDYKFWQRFKVSQRYEISVTEEDFVFTQDKNALDREYVLVTNSNIPLYGKIVLIFQHEFRKRELGSYLPDPDVQGNPKTFFKESRLKKEYLQLGLTYRYRDYLVITCDEKLGREVDYSYVDQTQSLSSFGTLSFSLTYQSRLGSKGDLGFTLQHRRRFGSFVRENQRSLWLPSCNVSYNF